MPHSEERMKRQFQRFFVLSALLSGIFLFTHAEAYEKELASLASSIAADMGKVGVKTLLITGFTDGEGKVTPLGRFIAEEIAVRLAALRQGFEVIDSLQLKALLAERNIPLPESVGPDLSRKIANIAGADAIVTGTLTPLTDRVRISCKVITVSSARIVSGELFNLARTKYIDELLGESTLSRTISREDSKRTKSTIIDIQDTDSFSFTLQEATRKGRSVEFRFLLFNRTDKTLFLGLTKAVFFDETGREHLPSLAAVGSNQARFYDGKFQMRTARGGASGFESLLERGGSTIMTLIFDGIPEDRKKAIVLQLFCFPLEKSLTASSQIRSEGETTRIQFRDISF